jgi:rare lipoprotein A
MTSNIVTVPTSKCPADLVTERPGRVARWPILVPILFLAGCSSATQGPSPGWSPQVSSGFTPSAYQVPASPRLISGPVAVPKGGGVYKVGNPYQVAGQWYEPREEPGYDRVGVASWYGEDFHGRKTSNGEVYDMMALTAAHPTLPMPSYAYITNLANNRTVLVRINDRGPYARDRIIDLSNGAARALGAIAHGTAQVRVRYAGPAPLDGNDWKERKYLASQPWSGQSAVAVANQAPVSPRLSAPAPSRAQAWSPDTYRAGLKTGLGGRL